MFFLAVPSYGWVEAVPSVGTCDLQFDFVSSTHFAYGTLTLIENVACRRQPVKGIWIRDPALLFLRGGDEAQRGELTADSVPHLPWKSHWALLARERETGGESVSVTHHRSVTLFKQRVRREGEKPEHLLLLDIEKETRVIHRHTGEKMRNPQVNTLQGTWRGLTNTWSIRVPLVSRPKKERNPKGLPARLGYLWTKLLI